WPTRSRATPVASTSSSKPHRGLTPHNVQCSSPFLSLPPAPGASGRPPTALCSSSGDGSPGVSSHTPGHPTFSLHATAILQGPLRARGGLRPPDALRLAYARLGRLLLRVLPIAQAVGAHSPMIGPPGACRIKSEPLPPISVRGCRILA